MLVNELDKGVNMTLGERIRATRESKGYSVTALAEAVGVTKQAMSAYEKGMYIPSAVILGIIADVLECSADYLLGRGNF